MKKFYLLFLCFLGGTMVSSAQLPGDLDITFNSTGQLLLGPSASHDVIHALAMDADQNIVACGVTTGDALYNFDLLVTRILPDGTLDESFGTDGYWQYDQAGESDFLYDIVVLDNGDILACGAVSLTADNTEVVLIRLNSDGTPDPDFGTNGMVLFPVDISQDYAQAMVVLEDGSIVVAGQSYLPGSSTIRGLLVKFNSDGEPDVSFGNGGVVIQDMGDLSMSYNGLTRTSDGDFAACGYFDSNFTQHSLVSLTDENGDLVDSFGENGYYKGTGVLGALYAIEWTGERLVTCGTTDGTLTIVLGLTLGGVLDPNFGNNGQSLTDLGVLDAALGMAIQPNGYIVVAGNTGAGIFSRDFMCARYLPDGTPDPSFGTDGEVSYSAGPDWDEANDVVIQADGKIVLGGFKAIPDNDLAFMRLIGDDGAVESVSSQPDLLTLTLSPNPAVDVVHLSVSGAFVPESWILYDISGRLCGEGKVKNVSLVLPPSIANGTYQLSLVDQNGLSIRAQLVVRR